MKTEFYQMEYEAWDEGTDDLNLEQEAAYLRLCHQMYRRRGPIPCTMRTLARLWRCHVNKADKLLSAIINAGKIYINDAGELSNNRVETELERRANLSATRRVCGGLSRGSGGVAADKSLKDNNSDQAIASRVEKRREENNNTPLPPQKGARESKPELDEKFKQFREAYPRRDGSNPWKAAQDKFNRAVRSGANPDEIVAAAENYRKAEERSGNIGTRFVAQAVTWLNQQRWLDYSGQPSENFDEKQDVIKQGQRMAVARFRDDPAFWPPTLGPRPNETGCRVAPEILAEFGFREAA